MADKGKPGDGFIMQHGGQLIAVLKVVVWLLALVALVVVVLHLKPDFSKTDPAILLTFVMVAAVVTLLAAVLMLAKEARRRDPKGERTDALGLPTGSVAAIIALVILVVFSSTSVFLFTEIRGGEGSGGYDSSGLTAEMVDDLPEERILYVSRDEGAAQGDQQTYSARMAANHEESIEYARTMLTVFSTLLVAIVGFYFGQGSLMRGIELTKDSFRLKDESNGPPGGEKSGPAGGT